MTSILAALPPELLDRIISSLSDERKDISACRLVCRTFKELGSPYLITRVVLAQRLDAVSKLEDVLEHPRYVTELVYDASQYNSGLSEDWDEYLLRCQTSPREFIDTEWYESKRTLGRPWHRFAAYSDLGAPIALPTRRTPEEDWVYLLRDNIHTANEPVDLQIQEDVFRCGCHRTFAEYYQRYQTQDRMEEAHLTRNMLPHIFAQLPKLRTIHFTDYRGLIRAGEYYSQFCYRLFGNTLEPDQLGGQSISDDHTISGINTSRWDAILPLLEAVSASPTLRIEQFSMATNPYVYQDGTCVCDVGVAGPQVSAAMPLYVIHGMDQIGSLKMAQGFSNLRRLDLPFLFGDGEGFDGFGLLFEEGRDAVASALKPLRLMLEAAAPTLTHLTLSAHGLDTCMGDVHMPEDGATMVFEILLSSIVFASLQAFELSGFTFTPEEMQEFLSRHQSSLIELRLLNNYIHRQHPGASEDLAQWGSEHLALRGVRIANWDDIIFKPTNKGYQTKRLKSTMKRPLLNEVLEAAWLAGRPNHAANISSRFESRKGLPWHKQKRLR